jgi:hypothetical protein
VEFQVLTVVILKSSVFCDIIQFSPLIINQRFGGTCHLHLQDRRISEARSQHETSSKELQSERDSFGAFTTVTVKSAIFCARTPCPSVGVYRRSGEHVISIFSFEEKAKPETSKKQTAGRAKGAWGRKGTARESKRV